MPPQSNKAAAKLVPPKHLKPETRRWWQDVTDRWALEQHHIRLLTMACCAWDRHEQARAVIAREGLTVRCQDGSRRCHPAIKIESDSRLQFARLLRELDLDLEAPAATSRPPALRSVR